MNQEEFENMVEENLKKQLERFNELKKQADFFTLECTRLGEKLSEWIDEMLEEHRRRFGKEDKDDETSEE
jgi:hypothetical protein